MRLCLGVCKRIELSRSLSDENCLCVFERWRRFNHPTKRPYLSGCVLLCLSSTRHTRRLSRFHCVSLFSWRCILFASLRLCAVVYHRTDKKSPVTNHCGVRLTLPHLTQTYLLGNGTVLVVPEAEDHRREDHIFAKDGDTTDGHAQAALLGRILGLERG